MKAETVPIDSFQVVSFSLVNETNKKKEHYAVPIEQVREIRNFSEITHVPKAKQHVKGIMNLRGMIIPVVDIKKRLGFGEADVTNKSNYKIIIADVRDSVYGLIVDKVEHVVSISTKEIEPVPSDSFESHHYIKGIVKTYGQLIVLLDIIALLEDSQENPNKEYQNDTDQLDPSTNSNNSLQNEIPDNNKDFESNTDDDVPEELKEVFREDAETSLKE